MSKDGQVHVVLPKHGGAGRAVLPLGRAGAVPARQAHVEVGRVVSGCVRACVSE